MKKIVTLFVFLAILLAGCGGEGQVVTEATPTPYPTPVRPTFTVQKGDIVVEAKYGGRVTPLASHTVYFEIGGQVSEAYANVNDVVTKGQLLGELVEAKQLRADADKTQHTIRRAQIDLEIAKLTLEQYKAQGKSEAEVKIQELKVELAQMNLDEVLESLGIDPTVPVTDEIDAQVAKARVFAPADGTIIAAVSSGRNVTTTTPAFVLGDPDQLEVVVDLDSGKSKDQVKDMYEGMPVAVTSDTNPGLTMTGTIRQLPSPYGTGAAEQNVAHIVLDTPPSADTYQVGDVLRVTIQLASKTGVLWLPPDAVRSSGGRTFVIVNGDGGPQRVDVEIGLQTRDMIEIISGLTEGQVVVGP
ncbi:MAG: efflux RND transporter periplasmic adaptor subunit [Anaerolineales bacterium]|nr:efflux RND transporter periplasmic adaptor subunit [Anaerolineales bacterium]